MDVLRYKSIDDLRQMDARARSIAQTVFDRPIVIEAGAGTGKTTILCCRIVAWCMGPGWEKAYRDIDSFSRRGSNGIKIDPDIIAQRVLDRITAITFTEAASAEMAQRIAKAFSELEAGNIPEGLILDPIPSSMDERKRRARAFLSQLDHLVVQTIHAFCFRLLSKFPIEAGLSPNLTVDADGIILDEVTRKVVEERLIHAYLSPEDDHFLFLAKKGIGPREIFDAVKFFAEMAIPCEALENNPFSGEEIEDLIDRLMELLKGILDFDGGDIEKRSSKSPMTQEVFHALGETLQKAKEIEGNILSGRIEQFLQSLNNIWGENKIERLKEWGNGKFNTTEIRCFGNKKDELSKMAKRLIGILQNLMAMDTGLMENALKAIVPLLKEVYREMRVRGVETFNSILRDTRDLLEKNKTIRDRVRKGIDQLLIDEFQDTDQIQCEIIRMITLDSCHGKNNTGNKGMDSRPALFCVGDPKQSIYGWRNADLRAYDAFIKQILKEGGELHYLVVNFRSVPQILDEVERIIGPVMKKKEGIQPEFIPLIPCKENEKRRGFDLDRWRPVEYWVSWKWDPEDGDPWRKTRGSDASEIEARAIARDILRLHNDKGVSWNEIGVLFRNTGDLDLYIQAFRELGIPYMVQRDRNYYRRREVIDAFALVCSIVDPNDHLSLITLMRSPVIGVPDAAIIPLWIRSFPDMLAHLVDYDKVLIERIRSIVEEVESLVLDGVPGMERIKGWGKNLIYAVENLALLRRSFNSDPPDLFVERIKALFLLEPTEGARFLGAYRVANLERFFRTLVDSMELGGGNPHAILRRLRKAIVEAREKEEGRPRDTLDDAVQVMTIHGAKGLDFTHVYIVQMHKGAKVHEADILDAKEDDGRVEYILFRTPTPKFDDLKRKREDVERAELIRTLYVAMTRARERLVLAGRWPGDVQSNKDGEPKTYMEIVQRRDPSPPPLWETMKGLYETGRFDYVDSHSVRWVFPGLEGEEGALYQKIEEDGAITDIQQVIFEAIDLEGLRDEARKRMNRPFVLPASQEGHEILRGFFSEAIFEAQECHERWTIDIPKDVKEEISMAVGSCVHRALEEFDLCSDMERELKRKKEEVKRFLTKRLEPRWRDISIERSIFLLERFARGKIMDRLRRIREWIIGREIPLIIKPDMKWNGPVGFYAGKIDLLYKDPDTGIYVIVDYKTDQVETDSEIEERARIYSIQGRIYKKAIREAFGLYEEPRFEIWFLNADRITFV
jgi:ATP-dependent helicase/nuclease subunit A